MNEIKNKEADLGINGVFCLCTNISLPKKAFKEIISIIRNSFKNIRSYSDIAGKFNLPIQTVTRSTLLSVILVDFQRLN
ncbi:hypothetical protein DQG23_19255 [Paenibacillus contaminans]|uniref:Uncharacterized protein n=1 Tax=Paenibacillus contaminans TaxID=450362 RepID=A0A329MIW1_9BACL|nr:hypothetical protein DQG23_19255 [Paenibacillus contaminans]